MFTDNKNNELTRLLRQVVPMSKTVTTLPKKQKRITNLEAYKF